MPRVRNEDNLNCPYCGTKQENLYGSGSDCSSCGKYFRIGITNSGYTSLWKVTSHLKYRIIRDNYKAHSQVVLKFIGENRSYFQKTRVHRKTRDIVVRYASSIGMSVGKIEKFHKEYGSTLSADTIKKILNMK